MSDDYSNNSEHAQGDGDLTALLEGSDNSNGAVQEEVVPIKRATRKRVATPRSVIQLYSLAQVAQIIDFTTAFDDAEAHLQRGFFDAFGWAKDTDADGLRVAQTVQENLHEIEAFRLFKNVTDKAWNGVLGFKDTISLVGEFSSVENKVIEAFIVIVNSIVSEDSPIVYRRNTPVADILGDSVERLTEIVDRDKHSQLIIWIDNLLNIWPGSAE